MIRRIFNEMFNNKSEKKPVVFFDLSSSEKKKVIKKAIQLSNKDQKELTRRSAHKSFCPSCNH